jgi:hypothetical protein
MSLSRLGLVFAAISLVGCGNVMFAVTYKNAMANDDYPALQRVCLREVMLTTGEQDVRSACQKSLELAEKKNDTKYMQKVCDQDKAKNAYACNLVEQTKATSSLATLSCDQVPAAFSKITYLSEMSTAELAPIVAKLASCDLGETIFEQIAHFGEMGPKGTGVAILKAADPLSKGTLLTSFEHYIQKNTGSAFLNDKFAGLGANHIGNWLDDSGYKDLCTPLVRAATGASEDVNSNILFYFSRNKCTAAIPLTIGLLGSSSAAIRNLACINLGTFGDKAALAKVKIVSETDTYYEEVVRNGYLVKIYPVVDSCKEAAGKIRLRVE